MPSSACCLAIAIFTLSLHDALPIWIIPLVFRCGGVAAGTVKDGSVCGDAESPGYRDVGFDAAEVHDVVGARPADRMDVLQLAEYPEDRKSTRLNSSHRCISYAVFCLLPCHRYLHSFPTRRSSDLDNSARLSVRWSSGWYGERR